MLRRSIAGTDSACVLVSQRQGNIKIDQDDISVRPAHNIGRFDISMKITDSSVSARKRVKVMQGREDLNRDPDHIRLRKDHSVPQRSVQTVALNIVHCCIGDTIFDKIIVYPGDIRMIQILQDMKTGAEYALAGGVLTRLDVEAQTPVAVPEEGAQEPATVVSRKDGKVYSTEVIDYSPKAKDMAHLVEDKCNEMAEKGFRLVSMSVMPSAKAILVFEQCNEACC